MSNNETKKDTIEVSKLLDFYWEACEDVHLWNYLDKGKYPIDRILTALKNFLNQYNHGQHNIQ